MYSGVSFLLLVFHGHPPSRDNIFSAFSSVYNTIEMSPRVHRSPRPKINRSLHFDRKVDSLGTAAENWKRSRFGEIECENVKHNTVTD